MAIRAWEAGHFLGASDAMVLREAHTQGLTLVTFDLRTIPPLLRQWAEQEIDHGGVILVDERTVPHNDIGGLIAALCRLRKAHGRANWVNRVVYLGSPTIRP